MNEAGRSVILAIVVLMSCTGAGLVLYSTSANGVGMSSDAVNYVSTARSLLEGRGFVRYDGEPYSLWPPLYPVLLACSGWFGADIIVAAKIINAVTFALTIFCAGLLFLLFLQSRVLVLIGTAAVLFGIPFVETYTMAWSDPLFFLLVTAGLWLYLKWERNPTSSSFTFVTSLAACSILQRYAGITLILTVAALFLMRPRETMFRVRALHAVVFTVLSMIPVSLWMFYNYRITGTFTGPRIPPEFGIGRNIHDFFNVISGWLLPNAIPFTVRVVVVGAVGALLVWTHRQCLNKNVSLATHSEFNRIPLAIFAVLYSTFILFQSITTHLDQLSSRYLGPLYIFLCLLLLAGLEDVQVLLFHRYRLRPSLVKTIALSLIVCWLCYPTVRAAGRIEHLHKQGNGFYVTTRWTKSPTIALLKNQHIMDPVFCNHPEAVYALTGRPLRLVPLILEAPEKVIQRIPDHGANLVWFDQVDDFGIYGLSDLRKLLNVDSVQRMPDATIYRLTHKT